MKPKLWGIALAAVIFSGCTGSADRTGNTAETVSETQKIKVSSDTTVSETTTAETASDTEAAGESEREYVEVSEGNEFIDFEFIEDYQGTTDVGGLADKAVEYLAEEFTAKTTQWKFLFSEVPDEIPDEFADYIDGEGNILPKFKTAYPNDYDGDGKPETFIVLSAPRFEYNILQSYLVFADSGGNMELIDSFCREYPVQFLNYGRDKQIIFGGEGQLGMETHYSLYGVRVGKAVRHYSLRGGFAKKKCFLWATGWQAQEQFFYFDTVYREYRQIVGKELSLEEVEVPNMDDFFEEYGNSFSATLIGGKYYCIKPFWDFAKIYTYENGELVPVEDAPVGCNFYESYMPAVIDIDIDKAISEMKPPQEPYAKVSEDNVFIDYKFIEDYQGRTDIGVLAASAVDFLTESEYYAESKENIGEFSGDEFKKYFDEGGNILPRLRTAYPEDYDGDGSTETFIIVDMPIMQGDQPIERSFLIYADSGGKMTVLSDASNLYDTVMLDYGDFKQITFGGYGTMGADDYKCLYGVVDGEVKKLYSGRISFYKFECFLTTFGWQGGGDFMYYDTSADEYRAIVGKTMTIDKIKAMDKDLTLKEYYDWYDENGYVIFVFIGGKYYNAALGPMDIGNIYTYENGKFILSSDAVRRTSDDYGLNKVADIDITKAIAEMKPPAEPYAKVSEGNVFIDYKFIEDYQGTTDIGVLANKAVEFLMTAEEYSESMRNTEKFTDEKFAPYIKDGKIVPQFNIAYPEDYDGDGTTETFIVADMPILQGEQPLIRSFFIFADSGGHMTLLGDESDLYGTILLDYGDFKQIIWGGFGTCGADENMCIYGVIDGQAKPLYGGRFVFRKENCFLTTHGHMSGGSFMYYDTVTNDYVPIVGVEMTLDEIKAMDKDGTLSDYYEGDEYADRFFGIVGGKYYCVIYGRDITEAVFTFDGKFERVENSNVRLRFKDCYRSGEAVIDIDIDKAIAEMISVK